jgi:putative peptidoglycan lipid II flippase
MSERRALTSGVVLAGRYELADLVSERLGSVTWRAIDIVLNRNVGVELLPSEDPRATHFLAAARESTVVTDARFLRVLDLLERERGHHIVVREWARAFALDQLLAQSALPGRRAADVVAEVAEAIANAHEHGIFHRRLAPHHILVKESGAVRIVGLGLASALEPAEHVDTVADLQAHELADVRGLGQLLYACLVAHWPDGAMDLMPAAPVENGRVLRPRQVRAGVSRGLDDVCDRILNVDGHRPDPLTTAEDVARTLRLIGPEKLDDRGPAITRLSSERASPDLFTSDPVVEPRGPLPGLPAARRPKAFEPPPPTRLERAQAIAVDATSGDRRYMAAGIAGVLVLALILAVLVFRAAGVRVAIPFSDNSPHNVAISAVDDFDPEGDDRENPGDTDLAVDGDPSTGWQTTTYFNRSQLGGLKDGVGLVIDLDRPRHIDEIHLLLKGSPNSLEIFGSPSRSTPPHDLAGLSRLGSVANAGEDERINLSNSSATRFVVVWLTSLPEVEPTRYRGEIREITIRERA